MAKQEFICENCDHTFEVDDADERVRCPECYTVVDQSPSASPSAEPSPSDRTSAASESTGEEVGEPEESSVSGSASIGDESVEPDRTEDRDGAASGREAAPDPSPGGTQSERGVGDSSQFSVANVLSTTFSMFFKDPLSFLGIFSPLILLSFLYMMIPEILIRNNLVLTVVNPIIGLILTSVLTGAMMYGVVRKLNDQDFEILDCFNEALSLILPLVGLAILQGLAIGGGLVLCLIPGIIVATMLYVCVPVLVIENTGVFEAMRRSYDLTSGNRLSVFGIMVVLFLISVPLSFIVSFGTGMMTVRAPSVWTVRLNYTVSTLVSILTNTITSMTIATTYYFLKMDQEGTTIDELVQLFD